MTIDKYRGWMLERNAEGYMNATPLHTHIFHYVIPFRNHEDAKRGIDILWQQYYDRQLAPGTE